MLNLLPDILSLTTLGIVVNWSLRVLALFVIPRNRAPNSALAWLMVIFLLPIPGWVLFLLFGSTKLPKDRRDLQARLDAVVKRIGPTHLIKRDRVARKYERVERLAQELTHLPLTNVSSYEIHDQYEATFARIADDIRRATKTVYLEYYIFVLDEATEEIVTALEDAKHRGVDVKVIYDSAATHIQRYRYARPLLRRFKRAGIAAIPSLPVKLHRGRYMRPDLRNHRKIITIDSQIGYIGSQNMIDKKYHRRGALYYKEIVVRVEGEVVPQLEAIFAADWYAETRHDILAHATRVQKLPRGNVQVQLVPSGPGYEDENNLHVFNELISAAEKSLTIVSPYFIPDASMLIAIVSAAKRGVRVRIINSEVIDQIFAAHAQRSYYEELLRAGVEIYLYKKPAFVHAKFMTVDHEAAMIGSSNMDIRSFELDHEVTMVAYDSTFCCELDSITRTYMKHSHQINAKQWFARPRYLQLLDNIARLTSAFQ